MPGSWYGRATNDLETICSGMDLGSNFVWALLISGEFTVFPRTSYGLHTAEHQVTYHDWLQSYCAVVKTCDTKLL